jgi:hypothetical protein
VADRSAAQQATVVDFLNNASADPYATPIVAPVSRGCQMSCAAKPEGGLGKIKLAEVRSRRDKSRFFIVAAVM